jgi:Spy/CpxP family protein refolding chaperone
MSKGEGSPRTVRLLTAILLVATFAAGTITGAGIARSVGLMHPPPPPPPMGAPFPAEELGLSSDQRDKTRQIMERHRPELEAVLRESFPKVRAIHEQIEREIREVLTPDQRTKLDQLKARRPPPSGPPGFGPPPGGPLHGGPPPWALPPGSNPPP